MFENTMEYYDLHVIKNYLKKNIVIGSKFSGVSLIVSHN